MVGHRGGRPPPLQHQSGPRCAEEGSWSRPLPPAWILLPLREAERDGLGEPPAKPRPHPCHPPLRGTGVPVPAPRGSPRPRPGTRPPGTAVPSRLCLQHHGTPVGRAGQGTARCGTPAPCPRASRLPGVPPAEPPALPKPAVPPSPGRGHGRTRAAGKHRGHPGCPSGDPRARRRRGVPNAGGPCPALPPAPPAAPSPRPGVPPAAPGGG
ncbi:proline-rich protein HaeIII subfamily 1-like [Chiroxiphia lanceolata]|uniref:proline-rich protein HaeIII subfamily 1-like n=1 Tax=Chiroxiphia lanceolata TaxID=296741 RepID=UPI0013CE94BF|nr:proline-rich protein HaeIII subfamily 1-like [Chiroxiphia lanceolata]